MTGRSHPVFRGSVKGLYFNETTCSFFRYFAKSDAILAEQSRKVFRDHVKGTERNTTIVPLFRCGHISQRNHYIHLLVLSPHFMSSNNKKSRLYRQLKFLAVLQ